MASDFRWSAVASVITALSTELNSLANTARAISSAIDNSGSSDKYLFCDAELSVTFGSAPVAGTVIALYFLPSVDGTNYPDDAYADLQEALWVGSFIMRNATAQRRVLRGILLPPKLYKVVLKNISGQAFPASGSTVKLLPYATQVP